MNRWYRKSIDRWLAFILCLGLAVFHLAVFFLFLFVRDAFYTILFGALTVLFSSIAHYEAKSAIGFWRKAEASASHNSPEITNQPTNTTK